MSISDSPAGSESPRSISLTRRIRPTLVSLRRRYRFSHGVTIGDALAELGSDGSILIVFLLALPFLSPVSLGPLTMPASLIMLLLGARLLLRNPDAAIPTKYLILPLPKRVFDAMRYIVLKIARRRATARQGYQAAPTDLKSLRWKSSSGLLIITGAILLAVPIPFLPLSNTIPALGIAFAAAGLLKQLPGYLLASLIFLIISALYFGLLAILGVEALKAIWQSMVG